MYQPCVDPWAALDGSDDLAMIDDEVAGGQYRHEAYDPYDPFSLDDAHALPSLRLSRACNP